MVAPFVILASASPRRRELVTQLGIEVDVDVPDVDETVRDGESAFQLVRRLCEAKATAVAAPPGVPVIGADTVVDVDGELLGKPVDRDDARRMLGLLSARTHQVRTGVAVRIGDRMRAEVVSTDVTFDPLPPDWVESYLSSGEPMDKAGAYAIQGAGGAFVAEVRGSVTNVVGLPLTTLARILRAFGIC